jgi:hypothetical protein
VLQAIGSDTLFADMGAAYDCLPGEVKSLIDDMVAVHDGINTFGRGMKPKVREALRPDFSAVEHLVVRTHPETGRKTLYVNRAFTQHIVGLDGDESTRLLEYLYLPRAPLRAVRPSGQPSPSLQDECASPCGLEAHEGEEKFRPDTLTAIKADVVRLLERLLNPASKFVAKRFPQPRRRKP